MNSRTRNTAALMAAGAIAASCDRTVELQPEIQAILPYQFGESREALSVVEDMVDNTYGDSEARLNLERQLAQVLVTEEASYMAKDFACRQLYLIGTAESVPTLKTLLSDPELSDMARYALEQNPAPEVTDALCDALDGTQGLVQVGIINSLGNRLDRKAVAHLESLSSNSDPQVANAAQTALRKINAG